MHRMLVIEHRAMQVCRTVQTMIRNTGRKVALESSKATGVSKLYSVSRRPLSRSNGKRELDRTLNPRSSTFRSCIPGSGVLWLRYSFTQKVFDERARKQGLRPFIMPHSLNLTW